MGLTPVPVRGKRKRNMNIPLNKPPTALRQHYRQGLQLNQDELPVKHQKVKHSLLAILAMRQYRLATLESLPIEVLESIFLHSSNLSLPRASPILGAKLSGKATLLRLFTWGFHDTWDQWFGIPTSEKVFFGPQRRTVTSWSQVARGNAALQSAILELPWVDIDFILQAQQMWADTYARDRWYQHPVPIRDECSYVTKHDCEGGFGHFNAKECFEVDYQNYKTWVFPSDFIHDWSTYDVHPLTRIPESLITGPWDEEKQRRLFWLIRGGAHVGPPAHGTQPWEVKVECIRNAVIDAPNPNPFIANLLFTRLDTSWGITGIPDDVIRAEVRKLQKRLDGAEGEAKEIFLGTKMLLGLPAVRSQYPPH